MFLLLGPLSGLRFGLSLVLYNARFCFFDHVADPRERRARRGTEDFRLRRGRSLTRIPRRARRRGHRFSHTRRLRGAHMRVVHIVSIIVIRGHQATRRDEEHVIATFARVIEHRFRARRARRDQVHTTTRARAERRTRRRATIACKSFTTRGRLVLIHILEPIRVLRHKRIGAIEEQTTTIGQITRLIQRSRPIHSIPSGRLPANQ